jgi:hypothetical protein
MFQGETQPNINNSAEKQRQFQARFEKNIEVLKGPNHMQFYLGNGRDGRVYVMHNPEDPTSSEHGDVAIKLWGDKFNQREAEIDLQERLVKAAPELFRVPRLIHTDFSRGAFAMERVPGQTIYRILFRGKKKISADFFQDLLRAFSELNKLGICHNDAHTENYMLTNIEEEEINGEPVVVDADIWIIDFGRSLGSVPDNRDLEKIRFDLRSKVVKV